MKHVLAMSALLISLSLPALARAQAPYQGPYGQPQGWHGVLSATDQSQFDGYYQKWVDATRRNDQDDISNDARKMQGIMTRYNIPTNVPFDQVASAGPAGAAPYGAYPAANPYSTYGQRLSPDDQKQCDKAYQKWMDATRKNDRDDIDSNARKMQDIMVRYNIPSNVPFAQIATGGGYAVPNAAYPNPAYGYPAGQRLSPDDQKNFDKYYKKWVDARRKNDRDDIDSNAKKMEDIMARYNIPANVPFDRIAGASNR